MSTQKNRIPPLSVNEIKARLDVNCESGACYWIDATEHHKSLNGKEAGWPKPNRHKKSYWVINFNGHSYRRSQIVFAVSNGEWPVDFVDHINGDSLDDRAVNLRPATMTQNAWNHKTRAKKSLLPMGVRATKNSRKFEARIACNKQTISIGTYDTPEEASAAYSKKRKELFGEFS